MAHHGQVMRDEDVGERQALAQLRKQVDDLCLDRDIEGGDRLVRNDEAGLHRERTGNADALTLAARKFMRIALQIGRWQADKVHQLPEPRGNIRTRADRVDVQRLGNEVTDPATRVQRGGRVLKDHLHAAAERAELPPRRFRDVHAFESQRSVIDVVETRETAPEGRLAATGFTNQPQRLPWSNG